MPDTPTAADPKAQRLAAALRANLRRRKGPAAASAPAPAPAPAPGGDPSAVSRVGDGAEGGEALYPHRRRASGDT